MSCFIRGGFGRVDSSPSDGSSVRGVGGGSLQWGGAGAVTSEGLVQVLLAKDNIEVMHSTGVELHTEDHITGRAAELLVVTLQLWRDVGTGCQQEPLELGWQQEPPEPGWQHEPPELGKEKPGSPEAQGPPVAWLLPAQGAEPRLLTRMSPLSSKPGSMVMQMPVWLSPCTLLQRGRWKHNELWCRSLPPRALSTTSTSPFHPNPSRKGTKHRTGSVRCHPPPPRGTHSEGEEDKTGKLRHSLMTELKLLGGSI